MHAGEIKYQMLKDFTEKFPGITAALLLTSDGLTDTAVGLANDAADTLAAMSSSLVSLANHLYADKPGAVKQTFIEHDFGRALLMRADTDTSVPGMAGLLLVVLTTPEANAGAVAYEMSRWIKGINAELATPVRAASHPGQ
ncbi:roadblock/LC7 domain-containing protein [Streptomyces sp. NPDC020883]|uniref:roadblock/LC7 domain-containing protein n=1 Tax=Streptomyces sp. NPDC020883 TaxID=3365099 RepID=UPI003791658D